jgi:lipoprotein signal peptidase
MQTPGRKGLAVTDLAGHLRLWLTVVLGVGLDVATKYLAWHFLDGPLPPNGLGHDYTFIDGWLRFECSKNPGVVFGLNFVSALGLDPSYARIVTAVLTLATVGLIFYVFATSKAAQRWLHVWCGLVMAGALGNLYDRLLFGYVRDMIHVTRSIQIGDWSIGWPYVFNVADVYLVVGVVAVAAAFLFVRRPSKDSPK